MVRKERVVELAHELPEVEDGISWGSPVFKVRGKTFAGLSVREPGAVWARCDREERPPGAEAARRAVLVRLDQQGERAHSRAGKQPDGDRQLPPPNRGSDHHAHCRDAGPFEKDPRRPQDDIAEHRGYCERDAAEHY